MVLPPRVERGLSPYKEPVLPLNYRSILAKSIGFEPMDLISEINCLANSRNRPTLPTLHFGPRCRNRTVPFRSKRKMHPIHLTGVKRLVGHDSMLAYSSWAFKQKSGTVALLSVIQCSYQARLIILSLQSS